MPIGLCRGAQASVRDAAACGDRALNTGHGVFAGNQAARVYMRVLNHYITATESITLSSVPEAAMRAEVQKLVDSIKEALVLLRRHL